MSGRSRGEEGDGSLGGGREKREKRGHDLNPKVDITPRKENKEGGGLGGVFPPSAGCRTHAAATTDVPKLPKLLAPHWPASPLARTNNVLISLPLLGRTGARRRRPLFLPPSSLPLFSFLYRQEVKGREG